MITHLLGLDKADALAAMIIGQVKSLSLQGHLQVIVPVEFDSSTLDKRQDWLASLSALCGPGAVDIQLPGGIQVQGDLRPVDGSGLDADEWMASMKARLPNGARLYAESKAIGRTAQNPLELQMISPRRTGVDLVEYLWDRKFSKAAMQCSADRGGVLVFEWEGVEDPAVFSDSPGIQDLLARTYDQIS
ncbi:hypothetical protein CSC73_15200 [Pseudoxanthomonas sacheonensis]|nr:hypothetical protein CSC73_15200 [Pseudoxanthomonas sacheonensis]